DGREYHFRSEKLGLKRAEDLMPLPVSFAELLTRETERPSRVIKAGAVACRRRASAIVCPEKYVLSIESHQGSNGSAGLVRAGCVMRDAGRTPDETLEYLLTVWNQPPRVTPPWSSREIAYAVRRHFNLR